MFPNTSCQMPITVSKRGHTSVWKMQCNPRIFLQLCEAFAQDGIFNNFTSCSWKSMSFGNLNTANPFCFLTHAQKPPSHYHPWNANFAIVWNFTISIFIYSHSPRWFQCTSMSTYPFSLLPHKAFPTTVGKIFPWR